VDPLLTLIAVLLFSLSVVLFVYGIRERRRERGEVIDLRDRALDSAVDTVRQNVSL
jgi:hypothetical protein